MARRKSLRSQLYRAAHDLGNVQAAEKGPAAYGKRVVRRAAYRKTNAGLGRLLRRLLKWANHPDPGLSPAGRRRSGRGRPLLERAGRVSF